MATRWNPAGRSRAQSLAAARRRNRDPFNRGAPVVRVPANLCPLDQCEHAGLLHGERALALEERTRIVCGASGCDCKETL